jgi:TPR repeat protein
LCRLWQGDDAGGRKWLARATREGEQAVAEGDLDQQTLGRWFDEGGDVLRQRRQFAAAGRWFERAAAAKQSAVDGEIDHASLGLSLHLAGFCHSAPGPFRGGGKVVSPGPRLGPR